MTASSLLGMEWTSWQHFVSLQEWPLLEIGCWMESDAQLVSSEFPIGVRLGSDQETYLATKSLSPCSSSEIQQCLGSLSCWKSARRTRARSDGSILSFSIEQYICDYFDSTNIYILTVKILNKITFEQFLEQYVCVYRFIYPGGDLHLNTHRLMGTLYRGPHGYKS